MTIREVATQMHRLSVGGYFNGTKFSLAELESYLKSMFRYQVFLKVPQKLIMEISLPDGRWMCSVNHYNDKSDGFDYYIPDNRQNEQKLISQLIG